MKSILTLAALLCIQCSQAREITLTWDANNPAEEITEYRILLKNTAGDYVRIGSTAKTELVVTVPDEGSSVVVAVAVNKLGLAGPNSVPLRIPAPLPVPPHRPTNLKIKPVAAK